MFYLLQPPQRTGSEDIEAREHVNQPEDTVLVSAKAGLEYVGLSGDQPGSLETDSAAALDHLF